jgi:uncharacterized protein YdaT
MIIKDAQTVIDKIEIEEELDFLFPELHRIHDHDLVSIGAWKDHTDWYKELSSEEIKQLSEFVEVEQDNTVENSSTGAESLEEEPSEYQYYEEAKQKFAPGALQDSLVFLFDREARQNAETYISERAHLEGLAALNPQNLGKASPLTVANLANYFILRDESFVKEEVDENAEAIALSH